MPRKILFCQSGYATINHLLQSCFQKESISISCTFRYYKVFQPFEICSHSGQYQVRELQACGILGHAFYLIVSFPDLCRLSYFAIKSHNLFYQSKLGFHIDFI